MIFDMTRALPDRAACPIPGGWEVLGFPTMTGTKVWAGPLDTPYRVIPAFPFGNGSEELNPLDFWVTSPCELRKEPDVERRGWWTERRESYKFNPSNCKLPAGFTWEQGHDAAWLGVSEKVLEEDSVRKWMHNMPAVRQAMRFNGKLLSPTDACPNWRDICGAAESPPDLPEFYQYCDVPENFQFVKTSPRDNQGDEWVIAPVGGTICRSHTAFEAAVHVKRLRAYKHMYTPTDPKNETQVLQYQKNTFLNPEFFCDPHPCQRPRCVPPPGYEAAPTCTENEEKLTSWLRPSAVCDSGTARFPNDYPVRRWKYHPIRSHLVYEQQRQPGIPSPFEAAPVGVAAPDYVPTKLFEGRRNGRGSRMLKNGARNNATEDGTDDGYWLCNYSDYKLPPRAQLVTADSYH